MPPFDGSCPRVREADEGCAACGVTEVDGATGRDAVGDGGWLGDDMRLAVVVDAPVKPLARDVRVGLVRLAV